MTTSPAKIASIGLGSRPSPFMHLPLGDVGMSADRRDRDRRCHAGSSRLPRKSARRTGERRPTPRPARRSTASGCPFRLSLARVPTPQQRGEERKCTPQIIVSAKLPTPLQGDERRKWTPFCTEGPIWRGLPTCRSPAGIRCSTNWAITRPVVRADQIRHFFQLPGGESVASACRCLVRGGFGWGEPELGRALRVLLRRPSFKPRRSAQTAAWQERSTMARLGRSYWNLRGRNGGSERG